MKEEFAKGGAVPRGPAATPDAAVFLIKWIARLRPAAALSGLTLLHTPDRGCFTLESRQGADVADWHLRARAVMPTNSISDRHRHCRRKPFACRLVRRQYIAVDLRPKSRRKDKVAGNEQQRLGE